MKLPYWIAGVAVLLIIVAVVGRIGQSRDEKVLLYYYDAAKDIDANGVVQCSQQGLVAVERLVPSGEKTIRRVVEMLLGGDLTESERAQGLVSNYPLSGVVLTETLLDNGVATLEFNDPQHRLSGGACFVSILWLQTEATVRQFPGIRDVRFRPEDLFQP